uniref:ANK_REP_REGION domain-containing protein n=1 Tax=Macrostomum lignano TaxID=282301 RepID=A0A1I8GRB2_9PLAT
MMTVKRKDFQKTAAYIHQFLLKLDFTPECAEVRDTLNLALLYMQKYYRSMRRRVETRGRETPSLQSGASSARGLQSPMTPFSDSPDKFQWRWPEVDSRRFGNVAATQDSGMQSGAPLSVTVSRNGDLETLKTLFKKDPRSIDEPDCFGRSPLMHAAQHNQFAVAEWLLRSGANVNACAHDRSTALHVAISRGHADLAELLVKYEASPDERDVLGRAPMHWSVTSTSTECLKLLLRHRADPRVRDADQATPAMWACRLDRVDHFALLSARLAAASAVGSEDDRDALGRTYVHWAVRRQEPLECLKDQRTAAHLATLGGHGEVLNYLLDSGANLELRDSDNATLWDYAKQRHLNYCKLIIASHFRQRYRDNDATAAAGGSAFNLNSMSEQLRGSMPMEISPRPPTTPPPTIRRRLRSLEATTEAAATATAAAASSRRSSRENWADASGGFDRKESEDDGVEMAVASAEIPDPLLGLIGATSSAGSLNGATVSDDPPAMILAHDEADPASDSVLLPPPPQFQADSSPGLKGESVEVASPADATTADPTEEPQPVNVLPSPRPLPAQLQPLGVAPGSRLPGVIASEAPIGNGDSTATSTNPTAQTKKKKKTKRRAHSSTQQQQQNGFSSGISPAAPLAPPGAASSGGLFQPLSPRAQLLDGANAGPPWLGHQRPLDFPIASPRSGHQQTPPQLASATASDSQQPPSSPSGVVTSPPQGKGIFFPVPGKPRPTWVAGPVAGRGSEL